MNHVVVKQIQFPLQTLLIGSQVGRCYGPIRSRFEEEELELRPFDKDCTSPLECLERPGADDDAVPGLLSIGGGG